MKKIFILFVMPFLISCSTKSSTSEIEVSHSYDEVEHLSMEWNELLTKENAYYCYVYSIYCTHCENIKNYVIEKALLLSNLYFIKYTKTIPIIPDSEITIGQNNIENIGIMGTPTIIGVDKHEVTINVAGETKVLEIIQKL